MSEGVTILLVEDDEVDVESVRLELRDAGIQNPLRVANDGRRAGWCTGACR